MLRAIGLIAFVGCAFGANLPSSRIVGGNIGQIQNFAYQASMEYLDEHRCGASIINPTTLITAAHCLQEKVVKFLKIRVGSNKREEDGVLIPIRHYVNHPEFNFDTFDYDIAILFTAEKIPFNDKVKSIKLADVNEVLPVTKYGVVSGWGRTTETGSGSDILRYVSLPIWSMNDCGAAYGYDKISDRMFCAGFPGGEKDACQQDSGGPFVVGDKLVGVVSWGEGCARVNQPGIYANVAKLRTWVEDVLKNEN